MESYAVFFIAVFAQTFLVSGNLFEAEIFRGTTPIFLSWQCRQSKKKKVKFHPVTGDEGPEGE
jgi:hypothetical protein